MHSFRRILALIFLFAVAAAAQTPDTATLLGQITDAGQAVIPGASIKLTEKLTGATRTAESDSEGRFRLAGLPIGNYSVTASKAGFANLETDLTLRGGSTAEVQLELKVAGVSTEVVVTGAAGQIRTDEPQLGDRLGPVELDELPLLNRRITYLPLVNAANRPAINQGDVFMNQLMFNTNGSGRRQTAFVADGSTANDSWGRQTIFTNIPLLAVQEMTVLESAFSSEYGATTGGVVNIITKTGWRNYHGDILGNWRPDATSAKLAGFTETSATSGNQIISDTLGQFAAMFSGPIPHTEQTHFLFAGEYSRQDRGSPVTSPVDPGVFVGHYTDWMTFLKLDHQFNASNTGFLRANTDSFHDTNPNGAVGGNNLPTVDRIFRRRTYTLEAGETAVLTPVLLNNARVQFQLASPITEFDPVIFGTQFVVPITAVGTFTSGTSQSALLLNRQYEFNDTLAYFWRDHQFKFGADVLHAHNGGNSKEFGGPIFLGQLTYNTCTNTVAFCESQAYLGEIANVRQYTQSFGNANYTVDDTLWALFAQDNWRIRHDLTLNLGLRYERQTFTDSNKDFAPRIGLSYDVLGRGRTVIRASYGIYHSQVVDNAQANYALGGPTGVFNYTAGPGQIGFPPSVSAVPLPAFPPGAVAPVRTIYLRPGRAGYYDQFFDTSLLIGYPDMLQNPYSQQWTLGVEHRLAQDWVLSVDYVGSHTIRVVRPLDVDPPTSFVRTAQGQTRSAQAANCTRPLWVDFYAEAGRTCNTVTANPPQPAYGVITSDVNNGFVFYDALNVNLNHRFSQHFYMLASYVYSHSIDNVDPDAPGGNPNDPRNSVKPEKGNAIFDQRNRFVVSGVYNAPYGFSLGGIATLASGLPFNYTTGTTNSGDNGATTDRPVINGVVVGRNTGRGRAIYEFAPFVAKDFSIGERVRFRARAEAFNVFNHANFVGYNGVFGNGVAPAPGFGAPLTGITNQLPARSMQFSARLIF